MNQIPKNCKDLTGLVFGKLTAIQFEYMRKSHSYWLYRCECGVEKIIRSNIVTAKQTVSCGCYHIEQMTSHGLNKHPLYSVWNSMNQRCYNPGQFGYPEYGGRGISVEPEWRGEEGIKQFIEDMFPSYQEGLTLERIDVNLNYSKQNCKWAGYSEQGYNRRKAKNNKTGKTGVSYLEHKPNLNWHAYIYKDNKKINLGRFASFDEAVKARKEAEIKYFGFNKE